MSHVPRLFVDQPPVAGALLILEADRRHHLLRVLKRSAGDPVRLCDGADREYPAVIEGEGALRVGPAEPVCRESPLAITVVQGIARGERMDYTIQKAVELGAAAIQPVFTRRCGVKLAGERLQRRRTHWQAVARSAAEQSGRTRLPAVAEPVPLETWLHGGPHQGYVLDPAAPAAAAPPPADARMVLLVGPEGGLDAAELKAAQAAGLGGLRLGPRVLRTETAALAALAVLQSRYGDF